MKDVRTDLQSVPYGSCSIRIKTGILGVQIPAASKGLPVDSWRSRPNSNTRDAPGNRGDRVADQRAV